MTDHESLLLSRLNQEPARGRDPAPVTGFPLRVAAVDMGSNAIRYLAAEFDSADRWRELASERLAVRLGHDVFLTGELSEGAMDAAIAGLERFAESMEALGITEHRGVATSAVRESRNSAEFLQRVREETPIRLETITGSEEARLVWLAVRYRVPLADRKWFLADLGGGSLEVSLVDSTGILWSESHRMGSVRLLEELSEAGDAPDHFRRLLAEYAGTMKPRIEAASRQWKPAGLIATGGNIESLAILATGMPGPDGVSVLTVADLHALVDALSRLSFQERIDQLGLREDRADVILPAAVVYERLGSILEVDRMLVPHVGVKDGVLLDLVADLTKHQEYEVRQEREVASGARALGRRYLYDEAHAEQVTRLSLSLFDQLGSRHHLGEEERRILLAAALLHDVGQFISYRKHHKHSYYIISNSELPDLTPRQIQLTALVARYHRRAEPDRDHYGYRELSDDDRERVWKLASILRVADALDREHLQRVRDVRAWIEGTALHLKVHGEGEFLLERWAIRKKAKMFEETFGLDVELSGLGEPS